MMLVMPIAYLVLNLGLSKEEKKNENSKVNQIIQQCEDKEASLTPINRASACNTILQSSSKLKLKDEVLSKVENIILNQKQEQLVRDVIVDFIDSSRVYNIVLYDKFIAYLCNETTDELEENLNQEVPTYSFEISDKSDDVLLVTATPKNNSLKSYYGVMIHQSGRSQAVHLALCESTDIEADLVQEPAIMEGKIDCTGNSKRVSNNELIRHVWEVDLMSPKSNNIQEKIARKQNSDFEECFDY
ncbi:hypothetical protein H1P_1430006 [Hyella patelloides LEGE 07179]|uniref:Uncharacterized protein n=2 Tax=Hyella TaxID=945733 RepID=A0A563VLK8_9CYAN|nr:hypothetical protein H1P_1430006 [Hyella patelloides LEGE 07179]